MQCVDMTDAKFRLSLAHINQTTANRIHPILLNSLLLLLLNAYQCRLVRLTAHPFFVSLSWFLLHDFNRKLLDFTFPQPPRPDHSHTRSPLTFTTASSTPASIRLTVGSLHSPFVKLPNKHLVFPLRLLLELKRRAKMGFISLPYQPFRRSAPTCLRSLQLCLSRLLEFFVFICYPLPWTWIKSTLGN